MNLYVETFLYRDENVETSFFFSVISPSRKCGNINGMSVFPYGVTLSWRIITSHIGVIYYPSHSVLFIMARGS